MSPEGATGGTAHGTMKGGTSKADGGAHITARSASVALGKLIHGCQAKRL